MPYRDEHGHLISKEEAGAEELINEPADKEEEEEELEAAETPLRERATRSTGSVWVDTGRGEPVEVPVGSPFVSTLDRLAEQAHYGGDYRVFLNGSEVLYVEEAPATIEAGMRVAITSYDKPG